MTATSTTDGVVVRGRPAGSRHGTVLIVLVVMGAVLLIAGTAPVTSTKLALLLTLTSGVLVLGVQQLRHEEPQLGLLHPGVLIFAFLFITYVGRPLYILRSSVFGTHQIGTYSVPTALPYMESASTVVLAAMSLFVGAFFISGARVPEKPTTRGNSFRFGPRLVVLFLVSSAAALVVVSSIRSGFSSWQQALSLRGDLFAGQQFLIFALQAYKFGFLLWLGTQVASWHKGGRTPGKVLLAVGLWLPTFVFDFLTGSRADLIYRNIIPTTAVLLVGALAAGAGSRIKLRNLLVPGVIIVLVFVIIRVEVRDAAATQSGGQVGQQTVLSQALAFPTFLLSGDEAAVYDAFTVIMGPSTLVAGERGSDGVRAVVLAPIPSAFVDKPLRSTMYFTQHVRPQLAKRGGNIAISGMGDMYLISGVPAAVLLYGFLGLIAGLMTRRAAAATRDPQRRTFAIVFGFGAATAVMAVLRADLTELALLPLRVGLPVLVAVFLLARDENAERPRRTGKNLAV